MDYGRHGMMLNAAIGNPYDRTSSGRQSSDEYWIVGTWHLSVANRPAVIFFVVNLARKFQVGNKKVNCRLGLAI